MADKRVAVLARVTGRVQGVYFRGWTQAEATRLGLGGWVRNEADGSVTALVTGPEAAVSKMLDALRQGPLAARVDNVATEPADPGAWPARFTILR